MDTRGRGYCKMEVSRQGVYVDQLLDRVTVSCDVTAKVLASSLSYAYQYQLIRSVIDAVDGVTPSLHWQHMHWVGVAGASGLS